VRVLMITPEVTPFAQTGGLGEVLSALPAALTKLGVEVDVLMPKYRGISAENLDLEDLHVNIEVTLNAKPVSASLWQFQDKRGPRYLFLGCDEYYDRDHLYGTSDGDYEDNSERFVFLTRAAIEMALSRKIHYDIFHSHDWQASLVPVYLRTLYAGEPLFEASAATLTIHNLGFQGIFWSLDMPLVGVGWEFFTPRHMEFHGKLNFLKSGIIFSDRVNTVSPGYRDEILTPEFGFGLEGVLQEKGPRLAGILNGVDYTVWNPETDEHIEANYGPKDLSGKARCKADLQKIADLPVRADVPLIGMVSRLSSQKGIDLLEAAVPYLMERDVQLVLLGTGEERYARTFRTIREQHGDKVGIFLSYDYQVAHKIFAGSDMLLVPSRYEPCGINQLYALKYGSVPVVRATGGLRDTVEQYDATTATGTGFVFERADASACLESLMAAVDLYVGKPDAWRALMLSGMSQEFSWDRSAREYLKMYEQALEDRKALRVP
jgi:starch synthase